MRKMYNKTDDSKCKAGHVIRFRNRHDASSRSGLLLRLGCAALALMLAVGGVSLLRSSFDVQLPVAYAEVHWDRTISTGGQNTEINDSYPRLIEVNVYSGDTMTVTKNGEMNLGHDSGDNDASEIELRSGATLNLRGKITGECERITVSRYVNSLVYSDAYLNVFLNDGAVFDVVFNKEYQSDLSGQKNHSPITCYGCNYDWGTGGTVSATYNNGVDDVEIINEGSPNELTKNDFYIFDPGPTYTLTATPSEGYSQVVWSKGPKGEVLQTTNRTLQGKYVNGDPFGPDNYTMLDVNGNVVNIRLMENAKYQVYANFIPEPKWTWDENNNAILTIYSYCRSSENGIKEDKIYGNVTSHIDPPTATEAGSITYDATVNYNGEEYSDEKILTLPPLGNHSNDYEYTQDSRWVHIKGSDSGMPVILKNMVGDDTQTFGKLQKVSVDGTVIYNKNVVSADGKFTAEPGSIKFTFLPSYLESLSVGDHTLKVELTDGTKEHDFEIKASGNQPGDNEQPGNGEQPGGNEQPGSGEQPGDNEQPGGNNQPDGNNNTNNSSNTGKGDWSPKTGDNHLRLFLAGWFFMASAGTIVMLLFQKKKKRYSHR